MTQEQNKPVRSRDEQIEDLASQIFFGARNHTDGMFEAKRHIQEAEARGAAEQRRKDAEGHGAIIQWRQGNFDAWKDCSPHPNMQHHKDKVLREYPSAQLRTLYAHPANVAALEDRIAELEKEVLEEQRISNLRGDAIDEWINTSSQQSQEIDEMRERVRELEGIADHACRCMSDGIEGLKAIGHGYVVQLQLRDEIEKIRAALTCTGAPS